MLMSIFFFFQAEDGIRDDLVTGVQTCALPIFIPSRKASNLVSHYMKAIMRDKIGSFTTRNECERFLNSWVMQYVVGNPDSVGQDIKAKYPLSEARVDVEEVPGKPGAYRAVAFLKPHFQLEELSVSMRLVAELPQSARG